MPVIGLAKYEDNGTMVAFVLFFHAGFTCNQSKAHYGSIGSTCSAALVWWFVRLIHLTGAPALWYAVQYCTSVLYCKAALCQFHCSVQQRRRRQGEGWRAGLERNEEERGGAAVRLSGNNA